MAFYAVNEIFVDLLISPTCACNVACVGKVVQLQAHEDIGINDIDLNDINDIGINDIR